MKKSLLLFTFTFVFFAFNVHPTEITQHMTGSWFNRLQDGHGFNIEMIGPNKSVFYWYVYNPDGTPTWLVGRGSHVDGTIKGVAYHNTGMEWGMFDPATRTQDRWGTVDIEFIDCNTVGVSYQSDDTTPGAIPYGSGYVEMVRLTNIFKSKCSESKYAGIYKGSFWSETKDEGFPATVLVGGGSTGNEIIGFVIDHVSFEGVHEITGKDFSTTGTAYENDAGAQHTPPCEMQGQIVEDYRLFSEFQIFTVDAGFIDVYPVSQLYFRDVPLTELAGNYEIEDLHTFNEGTATIGDDGTITGTDAALCDWNGQITILDEGFNMFRIHLTVTGCGDDDGEFEGLGFQDDAENLEDGLAFWFTAFSHNRSLAVNMTRIDP